MIACALVLVHDFPVMYFVLKSCTLFAKKVIGRNSRKLVAAKYYWRSNTLLIFHILPSVGLENVFFCFHSGYQSFLLVNENVYWNLIWAKELELNISMPQILKLHNRFGLNNKTSYAKLYFLLSAESTPNSNVWKINGHTSILHCKPFYITHKEE